MFLNPQKNLQQVGLVESMVVADFGSGSGFYTLAAAEQVGNSGRVYSIDVNDELLERISHESEARRLKNVFIIHADLEKEKASGLAPESVDLVMIANTLFQVGRKDRVADEAKRILKNKGRLLVVEWADGGAGIGPHQKHLVKKEYAISLFERSGFFLDKEIEAGDHHYGLIFRKK